MLRSVTRTAIVFCLLAGVAHAELPDGYWGVEQTQPILDTTMRVDLAPDLSHLSGTEFQALFSIWGSVKVLRLIRSRS